MPDFPQPIESAALPSAVMDYSTLAVLGRVADSELTGARLRKVTGLPSGEIILAFDRQVIEKESSDFDTWLFSADPVMFRVHPWFEDLPEKSSRMHFHEVVSHHLSGARVSGVSVIPFERVFTINFRYRDYSGEESEFRFIAELMGKHSNLLLVDESDTITACWKSVHGFQSRLREVRAGKQYQVPPAQDKITPIEFSQKEWTDFINSADPDTPLDDHFIKTFAGMSLTWAHIIADVADVPGEKVVSEISSEDSEKLRISFIETLDQVRNGIPLTGEGSDDFVRHITADFTDRADSRELELARASVRRIIERRRKKLSSLSKALEKDLSQAEKAEVYKKKADLLLSNMHRITPGMQEIEVQDWEAEGEAVRLPLDQHLTPQLQVEGWYKRYRKLKRTRDVAAERRQAVEAEEEELSEFAGRLAEVNSHEELDSVKEQLELYGLIVPASGSDRGRQGDKQGREVRDGGVRPGDRVSFTSHRYRSNDGFLIVAGTGDRSNEALRKMSKPDDIWLHVRDIPGAHVYIITRQKEVPETTLKEAAMVAVWHSKAREGSKVPVDYTRSKYITPIPGSGPGHVRFRRERTLRVTPDEKRLEMMRLMAGEEGKK